jgi:hypothetical protein
MAWAGHTALELRGMQTFGGEGETLKERDITASIFRVEE